MRLSALFDPPPDAPVSAASASEGAPALVTPARLAHWHGALRRGDTGLEALDGYAAFTVYEVPAIPDFSAARFPDIAGLDAAQRVQRIGAQQMTWLASLHSLGPRFGFSLRYVCETRPGREAVVRLFLIGRSFGWTPREASRGLDLFRESMTRSFPAAYRLEDVQAKDIGRSSDVLQMEGIRSLIEVLKPEANLRAWHDSSLCGFSSFYYPQAFAGAENDMLGLCHALRSHPEAGRAIVDICLVPTGSLTEVERAELGGWAALCEEWGREQKITKAGGLYSPEQTIEVAPDPNAPEARKAYGDLLNRYGTPASRAFLYSIRILSSQPMPPVSLAAALVGAALQPGSAPQLKLIGEGHLTWERALLAARCCSVTPSVCNESIWQALDAPETVRRLHRMADMREIGGFFRLPIAGRAGCPGMACDGGLPTSSEGASKSGSTTRRTPLSLGRFVEGTRSTQEEALFGVEDLSKHGLIVGMPGSGKTSLCFALLVQLWREHRIPFLVLEPAKTEYRALQSLPAMGEDLLVFTVGNERCAPWRFNPLEVPHAMGIAEHIATLNTCFSGAFSLFDPLPMLLDTALRECYAKRGYSEYGVGGEDPNLEPPTLADLYAKALETADSSSYQGEIKGNIRGALETRLGGLLRGPKGRCFNTRHSLPIEVLLNRPVIFELESLNDEEKALVMMFLLAAIRAHARTTRKSGAKLAHVVLVEEAHNVIGRGAGPGDANRANPGEVSIRFFTRMLAEMRALGEGMLIVDQLPTAIAPEAVKSTNLKVMHRVVAADDRQELGQAMLLDPAQLQQAAALPPGFSLVFQEGWEQSRLVLEPDFKAQQAVEEPPDDREVAGHMAAFFARPEVRSLYIPYAGCTAQCTACAGRIREESERWARGKQGQVTRMCRREPEAHPLAIALGEYYEGFAAGQDDVIRRHCAHVHFIEMIAPTLAPIGARKSDT